MLDLCHDGITGQVADIVSRLATQHGIGRRFSSTEPLVDGGFTSIAMVELMLGVEAAFDLTIPQSEMTPANFRSIAALASMLQRLRAIAA